MDSGLAETQFMLDQMEYRINKHYRQAEKELEEKIKEFYKGFQKRDDQMLKRLADKEITQQAYDSWRKNQLMHGKIWEQRKEVIAKDLYNANDLAQSIIYGHLPEAYASGHNFATYQIEKGASIDTAYTLYSRETVERLLADNPDLLPKPRLDMPKDMRWNKQAIQGVMIQGVLQGESIPHIAKRLARTVGERNRKASIRTARTMTTSAMNGGKVDAFKRAQNMGIEIIQEWRATFDGRTRDSHRRLDGERRPIGEKFSNNCLFPGDPNGAPAEVYNCRCTIEAKVKGFESRAIKGRVAGKDIEGVTYEEWKKGKNTPQMRPKSKVSGVKSTVKIKKKETAPTWIKHTDKHSTTYDTLINRIKQKRVGYNPVKQLKEKLSIKQIVDRVAGGDNTTGSCSSLTYAYIANKMGYDVLDFRGGSSRKFFALVYNTNTINTLEGVKRQVFNLSNEAKDTAETLKNLNLPFGKEYRLSVGRHAAIIRNTESGFEYLELQAPLDEINGWHSFNKKDRYYFDYDENGRRVLKVQQTDCSIEDSLIKRFGCKLFGGIGRDTMELTEVDSYFNDEFIDIMGYINTKSNKQKKGRSGHER